LPSKLTGVHFQILIPSRKPGQALSVPAIIQLRNNRMKFTVCVPTMNAQNTWDEFSRALRSQTARPEEVLVIDSESEDLTAEKAERDGFRVVRIARHEFRHGATRQLAAESAAKCDVLVFLTQDALLASPDAISTLLRAFEDPLVGAAYGRQLPRKQATPIEAHARLFNYPAESCLRTHDQIRSLGFKTIFFSNSFGAYRRHALKNIGGFLGELNFGEDTIAAAMLILTGCKIAYVAEAQVFHSHELSWKEEFRRYKRVGELHAQQGWLLEHFGAAAGEGTRFVISEFHHLMRTAPRMIPIALLRTGIKYLGYKRGRRSVAVERIPKIREFSGKVISNSQADPATALDDR